MTSLFESNMDLTNKWRLTAKEGLNADEMEDFETGLIMDSEIEKAFLIVSGLEKELRGLRSQEAKKFYKLIKDAKSLLADAYDMSSF